MRIPVPIVFHEVKHADALENEIREKARKLEAIHPGLLRCHGVSSPG
jgi:hypothetical protein